MKQLGSVLYPETDAENTALQEWLRKQIPSAVTYGFGNAKALGVIRRGKFVGAVVFHNFRGFDVEMSAAFTTPMWCLPQTMRQLYEYPFRQLGCVRMTTITSRANKRARRANEKMGFKLEGVIRQGWDGKEAALVYGMLRDECRWIKE